jgi:glycosyltransferase domain-containing protein
MNDVCVVIPTHERHAYLCRCINYYAEFACKVIICDSSEVAFQYVLPQNFQYYHWPGKKFPEKVLCATRLIGEEFVALSPDDDFLFAGALRQGAEALRKKPALRACVGDVLAYPAQGPFRVIARCAGGSANAESANADRNIRTYLGQYHQILWSVFRRETLALCFECIQQAEFKNENFFELLIATLCAGQGGIHYVDDYWILREVTEREHWGGKHVPITRNNFGFMDEDVGKFRQLCDKALFEGAAEAALSAYLSKEDEPMLGLVAAVSRLVAQVIARLKNSVFHKVNWERDPRFLPIRKALAYQVND